MTTPDRERLIADILENASIYLRSETDEHAAEVRGRWELLGNLMDVARKLRPLVPNPATLAMLMTAKTAPLLKDLGINPKILSEIVDSAIGPRLVGAVQMAHLNLAHLNPPDAQPNECVATSDGDVAGSAKGLPLVSVGALLSQPEEARRWLVDEILLAGGLSLLAAKPKAGKSTLARCLCVAVVEGQPWLGREVMQGPVFYLGFEEKLQEVRRHFRMLGVDAGAELFVYVELPPPDAMTRLKESVEVRRPALVVVDGLYRLVRVNDESGYAEVYAKLEPLLSLARESGAHVLMTHHEGKRANGLDGQDGVLGSTALVGSVDATLVIRRAGNAGRTIQSRQRYGVDLEESVLEMDDSGLVTLGATRSAAELGEAQDAILEALARSGPCPEKPSATRDGLRSIVTGVRTGVLSRALRLLWESGRVARTGAGRRGDPYLYGVPETSESGFSGSHLYAGTCKPESSEDAASPASELP